jgi:hypothetical protein
MRAPRYVVAHEAKKNRERVRWAQNAEAINARRRERYKMKQEEP